MAESAGWRARLTLNLVVIAATALIRLLAMTWRFRRVNAEAYTTLRRDHRVFIFALWHGEQLPLLVAHRDEGIAILISEHRDGEIIARVAQSLGNVTVRGSTTRGGSRALIGMVRALESGHDVATTPDGPRGPRESFAPGTLIVAHRAGAPVIALRASADRAWRFRSWDRFMVPKPFARITVAYGNPEYVDAESPRAASAVTPHFEGVMRATGVLAGG